MKEQDRKLAEEILTNKFLIEDDEMLHCHYTHAIEAMESYHQAKLAEVTDEDIERQIKQINRREALCTVDYYSTGFIAGAKAMRDGKIKHKEK